MCATFISENHEEEKLKGHMPSLYYQYSHRNLQITGVSAIQIFQTQD